MTYPYMRALHENMILFLNKEGLDDCDIWSGDMSKEEQLDNFGIYLGEGRVTVNGGTGIISLSKELPSGHGHGVVRGILSFQTNTPPAWDKEDDSQFVQFCKDKGIELL